MLPIDPSPLDRRSGLRDALSVVRLRKWWFVVTLLVTGFALLFAAREAPVYQTAPRDLVTAADVDPQTGQTVAPNMATETELASAAAVVRVVED